MLEGIVECRASTPPLMCMKFGHGSTLTLTHRVILGTTLWRFWQETHEV